MIAEAGLAALCLALGLAIAQLACLAGLAGGDGRQRRMFAAVTMVQAALLFVGASLSWEGFESLKIGLATIVAGGLLFLKAWQRPFAVARVGARVAWIGVALTLAGGAASHGLISQARLTAATGEQVRFHNWTIELHDVLPAVGPDWSGFQAEARATRGDGVRVMTPQLQYRLRPAATRRVAARTTSWDGELRIVLGEVGPDQQWPLRIEWRPFVSLISVGPLVAAIGALMALLARPVAVRLRRRRINLARAWWA